MTFKACSHTFCSTCIRTHINQPGAAGAFCPKCRQGKAYDSELVPLVHLEGTAECWRKVRPFIMDMWDRLQRAEEQGAQHRSQGTQAESSETGKRKAEQPNSTPESSVRRSKRVRAQGTSAETALVLSDDNVDDDDYRPPGEREAEEKKLEADDTVACPICNHTFTVIALNAHLDKNNCHPGCPEPSAAERGLAKAKPTNTSQWFNKPTALGTGTSTPTKKLTRPQYNLKSERDLKKLLEGLQLPTTGDKDKLAERHRQYVNLYNANLDAAPQHRKSEAKLRRELVEWERARDARGGSISDKKAKSWLVSGLAFVHIPGSFLANPVSRSPGGQ